MRYRISVDASGTFTEVVVADRDGGLHLAKASRDVERAFKSSTEALGPIVPELGPTLPEFLAADPKRVRDDVLAGFVSFKRASEVCGVAFEGELLDDALTVNTQETARLQGAP
jgi:hypothetical protein